MCRGSSSIRSILFIVVLVALDRWNAGTLAESISVTLGLWAIYDCSLLHSAYYRGTFTFISQRSVLYSDSMREPERRRMETMREVKVFTSFFSSEPRSYRTDGRVSAFGAVTDVL